MKLEILSENFDSSRISKDFEIDLGKGKIITVNKWVFESEHDCDNGTDIIKGKEIYDALTEEEQDEFDDFVSDECNLN